MVASMVAPMHTRKATVSKLTGQKGSTHMHADVRVLKMWWRSGPSDSAANLHLGGGGGAAS
eukprot:352210-Chlamydomonas_euryale.AAC.3